MPQIRDSKYIYAVSRIKTVGNRLLGRDAFDRMVGSATAGEAFKVLVDAHYGYPGAENLRARDFEKLLTEEFKKLYGLVRGIAPDPEALDLFLQPYDFHRIKVILKAEFAGIEDFDGLLSEKGSMDAGRLKTMIQERTFSRMPPAMRRAVEEALDDFHHTGDMKAVDFIIDRACLQSMKELAESFKHPCLKDYVACMADLRNMDIFLRLKSGEKRREFLQKALLPGGYIPLESFFAEDAAAVRRLVAELRGTPYGAAAGNAAEAFGKGGSPNWLEDAYHEVTLGFVKRARGRISGLEPLVAYLLLKEKEIGLVRRIMTGKLSGMSGDRLRERVGRLYA